MFFFLIIVLEHTKEDTVH